MIVQGTSATISGLTPATNYQFYVRAVDERSGRSSSVGVSGIFVHTSAE